MLQLKEEQQEYDTEQSRRKMESETTCWSYNRLQDALQMKAKEIRCREHYHEWLATQNILDNIRKADIREAGDTTIPSLR
jgi:hypothetical protein